MRKSTISRRSRSPARRGTAAVETGEVNALGAHRLFEAVCRLRPQARVFQASSADMFGAARESPQRETTPFAPNNPYSVAKLYAHQTAGIYRANHRQLHRLRHSLQSREPLSRHGLSQPEADLRRGLRQARHSHLAAAQRAGRADGQGRQACDRQPRSNARLGLCRRLRAGDVADAAAAAGRRLRHRDGGEPERARHVRGRLCHRGPRLARARGQRSTLSARSGNRRRGRRRQGPGAARLGAGHPFQGHAGRMVAAHLERLQSR